MKILKFIYYLLLQNPGKSLCLVLMFITWITFYVNKNKFETKTEKLTTIYQPTEINNKFYYTTFNKDNDVKLRKFDKKLPISKDNCITWTEKSPITYVSLFLFSLSFVFILITTFLGYEAGWEIDEVLTKIKKSSFKCIEEGGEYYYVYCGRLIHKSKTLLTGWDVDSLVIEARSSGLEYYPEYEIKSDKRDKKLKKLLK